MSASENDCVGTACEDENEKLAELMRRIRNEIEKAKNARENDKISDKEKLEKIDRALRNLDSLRSIKRDLEDAMRKKGCVIEVPLPSTQDVLKRIRSVQQSQTAWKDLKTKVEGPQITGPEGLEAPGEDTSAWTESDERGATIEPRWDISDKERDQLKEIGGDECDCGDIKRIALRKGFSASVAGTNYPGEDPISDSIESITKGGECEQIKSAEDLQEAAENCPLRIQQLVSDMLETAADLDAIQMYKLAIENIYIPE